MALYPERFDVIICEDAPSFPWCLPAIAWSFLWHGYSFVLVKLYRTVNDGTQVPVMLEDLDGSVEDGSPQGRLI